MYNKFHSQNSHKSGGFAPNFTTKMVSLVKSTNWPIYSNSTFLLEGSEYVECQPVWVCTLTPQTQTRAYRRANKSKPRGDFYSSNECACPSRWPCMRGMGSRGCGRRHWGFAVALAIDAFCSVGIA